MKSRNYIFISIVIYVLLICTNAFAQPVANFSAGPLEGCAPMIVRFIDNSIGNPTSWRWELGNGTISGLRNPTTTFFTPGLYAVKLIVSNANGTDTLIKTDYIRIYDKPVANFSVTDSSGCLPCITQFNDVSTTGIGNIVSWEWDFGD